MVAIETNLTKIPLGAASIFAKSGPQKKSVSSGQPMVKNQVFLK